MVPDRIFNRYTVRQTRSVVRMSVITVVVGENVHSFDSVSLQFTKFQCLPHLPPLIIFGSVRPRLR